MTDLSILCITRAEECVLPLLYKLRVDTLDLGRSAEFVLIADGEQAHYTLSHNDFDSLSKGSNIPIVRSQGYIESVLDEALDFTSGKYILRMDDDESISPSMFKWLASGQYTQHDHWKFSRVHLYGDESHYITNPPLYPDHQTRLSIRSKSGGRHTVHCGSPYGGGELAPVPIYHHKFLVKSMETRQEIVDRYERLQAGAGVNFISFSLPEQCDNDWQVGLVKDLEL